MKSTIRGYATVFNSESVDLGGFTEIIRPTAFDRVLRSQPDVCAVVGHDLQRMFARTSAHTLKLWSDDKGLAFEASGMADTQTLRDLVAHLEKQQLRHCSFGFILATSGDTWDVRGGRTIREVHDVGMLTDISIVPHPAYTSTSVGLRSVGYISKHVRNRLAGYAARAQQIQVAERRHFALC